MNTPSTICERLAEALKGVVRVADRKTDVFDAAHAALAEYAALPPPQAHAGKEPAGSADWRELERLSLLTLHTALQGFDICVEQVPLQAPATYLDRVILSCEFQPGMGSNIASMIATQIERPTTPAPASVSVEAVKYALDQALTPEHECRLQCPICEQATTARDAILAALDQQENTRG